MGQIPNYSKHRPRKIIYINKAVYEETDGERSMLAIIGYGTAKFSYQLTPTLIEPITSTFVDALEATEAPTTLDDFGDRSIVKGTDAKLYIKVASWVKSSPIGKFEIPDTTDNENITFVGYKTTKATTYDDEDCEHPTSGVNPVVTTERVVEDVAVEYLSNTTEAYIFNTAPTASVTPVDDKFVKTEVTYGAYQLFVKADWNLSVEPEAGLVLINNDVVDKLGPATDPDNNPLAFAASLAVTAGSGKPFYVVTYDQSTVTDEASMRLAIEPALRQLSVTDRATYLVGLYKYDEKTNKAPAMAMFQALEEHVNAMSTEEEQKWRRAYIYSNPVVDVATSMKDYVDTVTDQVVAISTTFENERMINVWADHAQYAEVDPLTTSVNLKPLDNMFVAVGVAALRSASQPHQGLSKTNLPWINNVKASYLKFIPAELDTIASYGTFIVCQDDASSDVYIRHQLTTETDLGLMYWEDSIGTNVDNIAYGIKDVVEPYPGRYNIVNNALIEIEKSVADYLTSLTTTGISTEDMRLGPQLIRYENLKVWVHKQLRDRIVISVDLIVPVPMNVVEVHLNAYITVDFEAETA